MSVYLEKRSIDGFPFVSVASHLDIFVAIIGLNVKTHKQKINWYWTWKPTEPLFNTCIILNSSQHWMFISRKSKSFYLGMPSIATNASRYGSIRSIIWRLRQTLWRYSLPWKEERSHLTDNRTQRQRTHLWLQLFFEPSQIIVQICLRHPFDTPTGQFCNDSTCLEAKIKIHNEEKFVQDHLLDKPQIDLDWQTY